VILAHYDLVTYLLHYVVARTVYTSFLGHVPVVVLIVAPIVILWLLHRVRRG
jgi:hypothetical protein